MQFSELKINKKKRRKKIEVGRGPGSGFGKTAGRGHKGQRARSGGRKPPWFEGGQQRLVRRLPKRGFNNIFRERYNIVNLKDINKKFDSNATVDVDSLYTKNLIKNREFKLKILADGIIDKPLKIKAHKFSEKAVEKIKNAGGEVEILK